MEERTLQNVRVFISSTSEDLIDFREAVFSAIQELGGAVEDMLYWSADDRRPAELCLRRVRASDILILVVGHRYGHVPEGSKYSITELEYRAAQEAHIPVLAFFVDPEVPWPPKYIERAKGVELEEFKNQVAKSVTYKTFRSPDDLKALVAMALVSFAKRYQSQLQTSQGGESDNIQESPEISPTVKIGRRRLKRWAVWSSTFVMALVLIAITISKLTDVRLLGSISAELFDTAQGLAGEVRDKRLLPLAGVTLVVLYADESMTATTDRQGRFAFHLYAPNNQYITLKATKAGFKPKKMHVMLPNDSFSFKMERQRQ